MVRVLSSSDQTTPHNSAARHLTSSAPSSNISRPVAATTAPHHQAADLRNETTGKHPAPACSPQTATTHALLIHARRAGPCGSDGNKLTLPLRDVAWSPATQRANRRDCTSEYAA